jgi:hypothetical protein
LVALIQLDFAGIRVSGAPPMRFKQVTTGSTSVAGTCTACAIRDFFFGCAIPGATARQAWSSVIFDCLPGRYYRLLSTMTLTSTNGNRYIETNVMRNTTQIHGCSHGVPNIGAGGDYQVVSLLACQFLISATGPHSLPLLLCLC